MTTICSNCFDINHMRIECDNQRANYLDYVKVLIDSNSFEPELFGNWIQRVNKYREFKENMKKTRPKPQKVITLEEESFLERNSDDDNASISSFKSTETMRESLKDKDEVRVDEVKTIDQQSPSSSQNPVLVKLSSFITKTNPK